MMRGNSGVGTAWLMSAAMALTGATSASEEPFPSPSTKGADPSLEAWLERLDAVADLYRDKALSFSCRETIVWSPSPSTDGRATFDYLYVFNDRTGILEDRRTLPGAGGKKGVPRAVTPEEAGVPRYLRSGMLWPLIFHRSRWSLHRYSLLGEAEAQGRPAIRIRFDAKPPYQPDINWWFGTAWVDRETGQLLQVEALDPHQHQTWLRFQEYLAGGVSRGPYAIERVQTEFGVERNGMRFPSLVRIEEAKYGAVGKRPTKRHKTSPLMTITQRFEKYQFFGVRTEADVE